MTDSKGGAFSSDGYIIDQRCTKDYPYGRYDSSFNGCGWIAVYNLLKALGFSVDSHEINSSMAARLPLNGMVGSTRKMLRDFLNSRGVSHTLAQGKADILQQCSACRGGILRYIDSDHAPHLVAFIRADDSQFRYFNAIEGKERHISTMSAFYDTQVTAPGSYALLV